MANIMDIYIEINDELPDFPKNEADPKTYEDPAYALQSGSLSDNDNPQRKTSYSSRNEDAI